MLKRFSMTAAVLALSTVPAFAHINAAEHGSFMTGLAHPFLGADHLLAMVAVGLWSAQIGGRARLLVPAAFVAMMMVGFGLAANGMALPFVEPAILASVIGLGLLVALAVRVPASAGMAIVSVFALFHGHAHGTELAGSAIISFGVGFILATTVLHVIGIAAGTLLGERGAFATRLSGGLAAIAGASLMMA